MGRRDDYRRELRELDAGERLTFLRENSGLPGPRGNLELVEAIADEGAPAFFDLLIATDEEYLVVCGAVGLGRRLADGENGQIEHRLRILATDDRWRVREGVAMAVQRLGDADPFRLHDLVADWAEDPHPLVQRAALAGICEPRLLETPQAASHAVDLCRLVTDRLVAIPSHERRDEGVRKLRQALGYCWSVAVAADPQAGLPHFRELERRHGGEPSPGTTGDPDGSYRGDPDVRWIVRENLKKARLSRLLADEAVAGPMIGPESEAEAEAAGGEAEP